MTSIFVAFKKLNEGDQPPPGYQYMQQHQPAMSGLGGKRSWLYRER